MALTCKVEIFDPQTQTHFLIVSDPKSDEQFGLLCEVTVGDGPAGRVHVSQLDLSGEYIRVLLMMGHDFNVPLVGIFVPLTGTEAIIGRWQTGFEESGMAAQLEGLSQRAGMKLMDRAGMSGAYVTQPAIGSFTRPEELLDARPVTVVERAFTR